MCYTFNIPKRYDPVRGTQRKKHDAYKGGERSGTEPCCCSPFLLSEPQFPGDAMRRAPPAQCVFGQGGGLGVRWGWGNTFHNQWCLGAGAAWVNES